MPYQYEVCVSDSERGSLRQAMLRHTVRVYLIRSAVHSKEPGVPYPTHGPIYDQNIEEILPPIVIATHSPLSRLHKYLSLSRPFSLSPFPFSSSYLPFLSTPAQAPGVESAVGLHRTARSRLSSTILRVRRRSNFCYGFRFRIVSFSLCAVALLACNRHEEDGCEEDNRVVIEA